MNNKSLLAGLSAAACLLIARADVTLVVTGGNASKNVIFDRTQALLTGYTKSGSGNVVSYKNGTSSGLNTNLNGLGNITIHYVLNGAAGGIQDLLAQNPVATASGGNVVAQVAVSSTAPETIGIDSTPFTQTQTLVIPFAYVKNPNLPGSIAGVTNLTQRQAAYLESAAGYLPTAFFGGSSTTDQIYLVGRNTASAVRQIIDANIYYTGSANLWLPNGSATNGVPLYAPVPDAAGGQASGAAITNALLHLTNAIGTLALSDAITGGETLISFEGYQPSAANVINGTYPIWGYERWLVKNTGAGQPSVQQATVISALIAAIVDNTYQHTAFFQNQGFVSLGDLQVQRSSDGGPITSSIY